MEGVIHGRLQCSSIYIFSGTFLEGTNFCGDGLQEFPVYTSSFWSWKPFGPGQFCVRTVLHCLTKNENIQQKVCGISSVILPIKTYEQQHIHSPCSQPELPGVIKFRTLEFTGFIFLFILPKVQVGLSGIYLDLSSHSICALCSFSRDLSCCSTTHSNLSLFYKAQRWQPGVSQVVFMGSPEFKITHVLRWALLKLLIPISNSSYFSYPLNS